MFWGSRLSTKPTNSNNMRGSMLTNYSYRSSRMMINEDSEYHRRTNGENLRTLILDGNLDLATLLIDSFGARLEVHAVTVTESLLHQMDDSDAVRLVEAIAQFPYLDTFEILFPEQGIVSVAEAVISLMTVAKSLHTLSITNMDMSVYTQQFISASQEYAQLKNIKVKVCDESKKIEEKEAEEKKVDICDEFKLEEIEDDDDNTQTNRKESKDSTTSATTAADDEQSQSQSRIQPRKVVWLDPKPEEQRKKRRRRRSRSKSSDKKGQKEKSKSKKTSSSSLPKPPANTQKENGIVNNNNDSAATKDPSDSTNNSGGQTGDTTIRSNHHHHNVIVDRYNNNNNNKSDDNIRNKNKKGGPAYRLRNYDDARIGNQRHVPSGDATKNENHDEATKKEENT